MNPTPAPRTRRALPQDAALLSDLENRTFDADRISLRSFRTLLKRDTALVLIAERDGGIAGYALLLFRRNTTTARLYSIAVDSAAAGKGVGRALLLAAERAARERGKIRLTLEVREDNRRAIDLYRKAGFRPIGRYPGYYADHGDALRFEKTLHTAALLKAREGSGR
ncbi:MAG: GNAT family N-acetyltransferase [Nitratireductor sp.]|nr:GNAT family N-acetyltransferase [Nitratireductor sp.]